MAYANIAGDSTWKQYPSSNLLHLKHMWCVLGKITALHIMSKGIKEKLLCLNASLGKLFLYVSGSVENT